MTTVVDMDRGWIWLACACGAVPQSLAYAGVLLPGCPDGAERTGQPAVRTAPRLPPLTYITPGTYPP